MPAAHQQQLPRRLPLYLWLDHACSEDDELPPAQEDVRTPATQFPRGYTTHVRTVGSGFRAISQIESTLGQPEQQ